MEDRGRPRNKKKSRKIPELEKKIALIMKKNGSSHLRECNQFLQMALTRLRKTSVL